MAIGASCHAGCVGLAEAAVRRGAWPAICAGILCLMLASMGVYPRTMSMVATLLILQANMLMILFSTRRPSDMQYSKFSGDEEDMQPEARLNMRVCLQAYGMLPISGIALLSLALYRAERDADDLREGRVNLTDASIPSASFLEFMNCTALLYRPRNNTLVDEMLAIDLHNEFIQSVLYAVVAFLVILGLRALFADILPEKDAQENRSVKYLFSALRGAHSAAIVLLIFAVVGYFPMLFSCIACGFSVLASIVGLILLEFFIPEGSWKQRPASARQVYGFFNVTLPCVYCVGCLHLEAGVMDPQQRTAIVHLKYVGFQLAFSAAVWLLLIVVLRSCAPRSKNRQGQMGQSLTDEQP